MRALVVILLLFCAGSATAACRLALALGLDVSGSVDEAEYRLQTDGLAGALLRREVQEAFLAFPESPIYLLIYEWAGPNSRRLLSDWQAIQTPEDLLSIAERVKNAQRRAADPTTALGEAIMFGAAALNQQGGCLRRTLDLSGDGESNSGPRPRDVKTDARLGDITINGLVIATGPPKNINMPRAEVGELWAYYENEVIRGPQAFVEVALGFHDFEEAMARKLLKETQTLVIGGRSPGLPVRVAGGRRDVAGELSR